MTAIDVTNCVQLYNSCAVVSH